MQRNFHFSMPRLAAADPALQDWLVKSATKLSWFMERGYHPHYYQILYHIARDEEDKLYRFRHLVAGRRGGKTVSAAWDVAFYMENPKQYWMDFHGLDKDEPLWMWALAQNHKIGRPSLLTMRKVLRNIGSPAKENRGEKYFEFPGDGLLEFKSADDPESLRGAGLHHLWIDESAQLRARTAWDVVYPSLSDHMGGVSTTTTPKGKNWFYEEFWGAEAQDDLDQMRVEYRSIDNKYFSPKEWLRVQKRYHPLLFKQEYMASFDSMAGIELAGDWLHYFGHDDNDEYDVPDMSDLDLYIGVDPAISLKDEADRFVISLVGVARDRSRAYLLEQWAGRIPFPDQVSKINEWYIKYRPSVIGVESVAYQAALVQQLERQPMFAPVIPILAKGKKSERILAMAPFFKIGKVVVRREHRDFIDEWLNYDSSVRNPKDDTLDSVEIALRTAGALMEDMDEAEDLEDVDPVTALAKLALPGRRGRRNRHDYDNSMGSDW